MAESSRMVTPVRRLTCWVFVRDSKRRIARVTPAATSAVTRRPAAVPFGDEKLRDFAFQSCTRVVKDDPAETNDLTDFVPDHEDEVLAAERGGDLGKVPFDLLARQLRMVDVVDLFAKVELDKKGLDQGIIAGRESFHVESSHPRPDVSLGPRDIAKFRRQKWRRASENRRRSSAGRAAAS